MTFLNQKVKEYNGQNVIKIGVVGICFDGEFPCAPIGVKQAPERIRAVSQRYANTNGNGFPSDLYNPEQGYILRELFFHDWGDLMCTDDVDAVEPIIKGAICKILSAGEIPCIFGGDHFVTYPALMAYQKPLTVIQFDAHSDYLNRKYVCPHGSAMRLAKSLPYVTRVVHCGMRGNLSSKEDIEESVAAGNKIIYTSSIKLLGVAVFEGVIEEDSNVYLSIDIDVLDPSIAFATRTMEPDGIGYRQLLDLLQYCTSHFHIVGVDIVEYDPSVDLNDCTCNMINNMIFELFGKLRR